MQFSKIHNITCFWLLVTMSLVAYSGYTQHATSSATQTTLIIGELNQNSKFTINYLAAKRVTSFSFFSYSFVIFEKFYAAKEQIAFKNYLSTKLSLRAKILHSSIYNLTIHKTLYNGII